MAIANNNVQNVKFLRNGSVYNNHDAAYNALTGFTLTAEQDGTAILARYTASDNKVKTLVGWVYSGATGSYITIQDVEGASSDVKALEKEIKDILGNGVSSDEGKTVSEQLAALSGGTYEPGTSSSADTSVEGAKAYAKDYTDAEIDKLVYTGVITGTGVYVTNVTQADGKISGTTAELPTVAAITEAGKPIIAVAENKGTISASAGTIDSQYATVSGFTAQNVQGALEEVKKGYEDAINDLDYSGITPSNAAVITNVTEEDGVVSAASANVGGLKLTDYTKGSDSGSVVATDSINGAFSKLEKQIDAEKDARAAAIEGLDKSDSAAAKKFVTSVSEEDGIINVSRGEITSSGKTIVLTDNADGGVNFEANVDGTTIIIDKNTGTMSVASSALVQYEGDGKTVQISAVQNGVRTVSSPLTISSTTVTDTNVKEQFNLVNASGETVGATIKIYKDSALVNFYLGHIGDKLTDEDQSTHESPTTGITTGTGDTALVYVMQLANGNYKLTAVNVESFLEESEFADGLSVANHVVKVSADTTSEKVITEYNNDGTSATTADVLTVSASGVKVDNIQAAINAKIGTLDATVNNNANSGHVAVEITEVDGKLTDVTVTEDGIASQDKLDELSGKTFTVATSSNASITTAVTAAADGTKSVDLITDASKIKMTGFTAETSGLTAVTEATSVTGAVKAIETEMIANEQTTATALNDLNTRVNTVSGDVDTIKTNYVSGVSVNGTAVTVANHVAPISITAATSATTATSTEAITVATNANGNITLGLATIDCGFYA